MKRVLLILLLASCSDSGSGVVVEDGSSHGQVIEGRDRGQEPGGSEVTEGEAGPDGQELPIVEAEPTWPKLQATDAWESVLAEVQAGGALPIPPTEAGGPEQELAIQQARTLTERLSLSPKDGKLQRQLASLYMANLFPERALAVLGLRLSQEPGDTRAQAMAAFSLAVRSRHMDALAVLEQLTDLTPKDASLAGAMFDSYWALGELEASREVMKMGLELHPFNPLFKLRLGIIHSEFEQYDLALPLFRAAAKSRPADTESWFRLATCLQELGQDEEAHKVMIYHDRLIQLEEFGIAGSAQAGPRRLELVRSLVDSGDLVGARRELDALAEDGLPVHSSGKPEEFQSIP
jgi:thioredoxin-like negative regulator of GroEL